MGQSYQRYAKPVRLSSPRKAQRRQPRWQRWLVVALILLGGAWWVSRLPTLFIHADSEIALRFTQGANTLSGSLYLPDGKPPFTTIILVHGDGAADRTAADSYLVIINALLVEGWAVYSWDKAGVGDSSGNWLQQTMADRRDAVMNAAYMLDTQDTVGDIGLLGFSQAGWVLPEALNQADAIQFAVLIGGAMSWERQSVYLTASRLSGEGYTKSQIRTALDYHRQLNRLIRYGATYPLYQRQLTSNPPPPGYGDSPMSPERYHFVQNNIRANSQQALSNLTKPLLAIWGTADLNVDPNRNPAEFAHSLPKQRSPQTMLVRLAGATHGLLKASQYNFITPDHWSFRDQVRYLLAGERAYHDDYFPLMTRWIRQQTRH